jgi:hypothetical protein
MISRIRHGQAGSAVIIAILAISAMLSLGLATIAFSDGQRHLASGERFRESAFNLAEGALSTQVFILSRNWPSLAASAYPASCSSTATVTNCPSPTLVNAQFSGGDYTNATWSTAVQDNGGTVGSYYTTSGAAGQPAYDANGDGKLWVQAQAVIGNVRRTIVTQVQAQIFQISFPKNTLTAGYFATTNNGKKTIVDTNGSSYSSTPSSPGALAVRCNTPPKSSCLNYDASKGQVSPPVYQTGYSTTTSISSDQLDTLRATAKNNGTYYSSGCPSSLTGTVVFVESGNCSYGAGTFNSLASPGMVVIVNGTLTMSGNTRYYGLVYLRNAQSSSGYLLSMGGNTSIIGGIAVDGAGGITAGGSATIAFNSNVFAVGRGFGNPNVVKSTWREL